MDDGLADLNAPVKDWILILNILWRLNQRFKHVASIIRHYSPFLNFLKVQDDPLLEEIHMDSTGPPAAPTSLYTNVTSPVAKPPSSTSSRPPHGGNGGNRTKSNNKNCNSGNGGGHNGKNSTGGGGRGGSSGHTTAPTSFDDRTNASWSTYDHSWQGHMTMYPGPVLAGQQRP
jgi:uncharacterized membrane protein YgcG